MNGTPTFEVINPLRTTVDEAEDILAQMQEVSDALCDAIRLERDAYARYKVAQDFYDDEENEALYEVIVLAQAKDGPLGGIASTSKSYDIALTKLKKDMRKGNLRELWIDVDRYRGAHEAAKNELTQCEVRFTALRKIVDLKTQVLRAATI